MKDYFKLLKRLKCYGKTLKVRNLEIKELIDEKIKIDALTVLYDTPSRSLIKPDSKQLKYLFGELNWYLSGERKIDKILKYSKFWKKIANDDGTANSNYGYLTLFEKNKFGITQFDWALTSLLKDKNSRQALILYNKPDYYYDNNKDFICTQTQQFFIRDNKLSSIVYLRSSDVIRGLTFDIPWYSVIMQKMHIRLIEKYKELKYGTITINFGSVHIYKEHFKLLNNLVSEYENDLVKYKKFIFF
jgi:thymidylate synthase